MPGAWKTKFRSVLVTNVSGFWFQILIGFNDEKGTFAPLSNITRAEAAAIVSRMAEESNRRSVTLKVE